MVCLCGFGFELCYYYYISMYKYSLMDTLYMYDDVKAKQNGCLVTCMTALFAKVTEICDMIEGNESLVGNFNSYFLAPHYFDPNPVTIG